MGIKSRSLFSLLKAIYMKLNEISSVIINDLWAGTTTPLSTRSLISQEQIEDEIIAERELITKEWLLRGALSPWDLAYSINCIEVSCDDMNKCPCKSIPGKITQHFEIPQLLQGIGGSSLLFVGSTDKMVSYNIYYDINALGYQKYRKKGIRATGNEEPYVYVDRSINANGMHDVWLFNAPLIKYVSVVGIFREPRQLEQFTCCDTEEFLEMGSISSEIIRRILAKKVSLYRATLPAAPQITS